MVTLARTAVTSGLAQPEGTELLGQQRDLFGDKRRQGPAAAEEQGHDDEIALPQGELVAQERRQHPRRLTAQFLDRDLVRVLQRHRMHGAAAGRPETCGDRPQAEGRGGTPRPVVDQ